MGYDRTIAVFSPDGRLFQVEYAKKTVERGITSLGITFKDGVILATLKQKSKLIVPSSFEKIFQIDEHIGAVAAGFLSDARTLANLARIRAQVYRITYEEPPDVWYVAKEIGDRMQINTLYAGLRPFGVSFLVGGYDKVGVHLIEADPSGMLYGWLARAIGRGEALANKILQQKWKKDMSEKEAVQLALDILSKVEKKRKEMKVEVASVSRGKKFRLLSDDEIKKLK